MGAVTGEVVGLGDAKTLGLVVRFWPRRAPPATHRKVISRAKPMPIGHI